MRISAAEEKRKQGNKKEVMLRVPRGLELPRPEPPAGLWEGTPVDSICGSVWVSVIPAFPTNLPEGSSLNCLATQLQKGSRKHLGTRASGHW